MPNYARRARSYNKKRKKKSLSRAFKLWRSTATAKKNVRNTKALIKEVIDKERQVSVIYTNSDPSFNWASHGNKAKVPLAGMYGINAGTLFHQRLTDLGNIYKNQQAGQSDSKESTISIKHIKCRVEFSIASNPHTGPTKVRFSLVQVNDATGTNPDGFMLGDLNGLDIYRPDKYKQISNINFSLLKSTTFTVNRNNGPYQTDEDTTIPEIRVIKYFDYKCNKTLTYSVPSSPDEEQAIKNNIYLCVIADSYISITAVSRIDFTIKAGLDKNIPTGIDGADPT